jgi:hypothetical protein
MKPPKSNTWDKVKNYFRHPKRNACDICSKRKAIFKISRYWLCPTCDRKDNWGIELKTKRLIIRPPQFDFNFKVKSV